MLQIKKLKNYSKKDLQYQSDESMEAVEENLKWSEIEANTDPQKLWTIGVQKHKVEQIVQLLVRQMCRSIRQGGNESIKSYK
jgi:hypothetical protein